MRQQIRAVVDGSVRYEDGLDALAVAAPDEVDPELTAVLQEACARLWRHGWQPVELHRLVGRRGRPAYTRLVTDAVAAHLSGFTPADVDPRWLAQAEEIGASVWWQGAYLPAFAARWRSDRVTVLDDVLTLVTILSALPAIEVLAAPPGTAVRADRAGIDGRLLDRVRALLAKAESTSFPAEAEAYTAKAQELVTRHSLDEAVLAARTGDATLVPFARRIGVDHPYEGEKASLLDAVARANRCHLVWSPELGFATVFGFDADIDAVELLHASLLVQAYRAMTQSEPPGGKAGKARQKRFRQSFLVAFNVRIGERLADAAEAALAQARVGADLLPVLASRDAQIRETVQRVFPRTVRTRGSRVDSREGWESGRAAADSAALA